MNSNRKSIEVRTQESEVRRQKLEGRAAMRLRLAGILLASSFWLLAPIAQAQSVDLGGTGALGKFINPLSVTSSTGEEGCGYNVLRVDLAQGKVFALPNRKAANAVCNATPVDITNVVDATTGQRPFEIPPTGAISDGVLEVTDFTLRPAFGDSTFIDGTLGFGSNITHLVFVPNANNTPVWLRATGNVTINSGGVINLAGADGGVVVSTFLRGPGGKGGPGGYRGGDGGNGGLSPSTGTAGFGPGGGPGGAVDAHATVAPKVLTTGTTVGGTLIPAGNDLLTMLRGGSGGGGGGGRTDGAATGGGGGGGGVLIAANGTITVSGTLNAQGGNGGTTGSRRSGAGGAGGMIRLVANTIAGGGVISSIGGTGGSCQISSPCPVSGEGGLLRLEAFTISFSGSFGGASVPQASKVIAASAPGQIFLPTSSTVSAFLKFTKLTNSANSSEFAPSPTDALTLSNRQDIAGRTGLISSVDVEMPDSDSLPVSFVNVDFEVGPNTVATPFPSGKSVTLVVTPLDPAQGSSANYTGAIVCPAPGDGNCTASISSAALPLGFSSFSAFTVVNISASGALAQMFPKMYEGEEIENVRIQTDGKGTEYVLIAKSGKEFPYQPQ